MNSLFPQFFAGCFSAQCSRLMNRLVCLCLCTLSLAALMTGARLSAVTPVPYTESASFSLKMDGACAASMNLHDETGSSYVVVYGTGSMMESDSQTALLRPGKTYTLDMWSGGPTNYLMSFVAPNGYSVYVDGVQTDLVQGYFSAGWNLRYYTVELRPTGAQAGGKWGEFSGIALGKSISWEVGLGLLRTGRSAGSILFKELDVTSTSASRSRLYYAAPPANVGQIVVIKDGDSNQQLRQIVTPVGFTDLVDISGGYEIRFYDWNQVSSWNGTLYSFSSAPWKTIKVESPAIDQLKITESEGTVVRVSLLKAAGVAGVSGGVVSTAGSYTVHTFTSSGTLLVAGSALAGVDYLVVGGGGGGSSTGGGGGGGSVEYLTSQTLAAGSYSVVVAAGGGNGTSGGNSTFNSTTGFGGYHGASSNFESGGGSGGGGAANVVGGYPGSGSRVYKGGGGNNSGAWDGGGGGGAGGDTQNQSQGGGTYSGGNGFACAISGSTVLYAAGGGGANSGGTPNLGGLGGGGAGGCNWSANGQAGATNSGSGGGGGTGGGNGGNGGSGVVIVRYPTDNAERTWTLQEGDGTTWLRTTKHSSKVPTSGQRDVVAEVRTGTAPGTVVTKTKYHYVNKAWGEELDSIIADPDDKALTTTYDYYTSSSDKGSYRKIKSVTAPTGNWTAYEYYNDWEKRGRIKYEFQPWLDAPATAASASTTTGHVTYYEYTADWTGRYTRPSLREERILQGTNMVLVAKTIWAHGDSTGSGEPRAYATVNSYRDVNNSQADYGESYRADADPDFAGQPYVIKGANQTQTSVSISRGTFNVSSKAFTVSSTGDHWRAMRVHGTTNGSGAISSFDGQSFEPVYLVANKSTLEVEIRIGQGLLYRSATYVYTGSGFALVSWIDNEYDGHGNLTQVWGSNGALTNYTYSNGRLQSTKGIDGTETQLTYDEVGRVKTSVKKGASSLASTLTSGYNYPTQVDITTTYTYDGANRVTQTDVSATGEATLTSKAEFDLAGRPKKQIANATASDTTKRLETNFSYPTAKKTTVKLPTDFTKETEVYLDGQVKSVTGTAQVAQYFNYRPDTIGSMVAESWLSSLGSPAWTARVTNWTGQITHEYRIGGDGTYQYDYYLYNSLGQLERVGHTDGAATHFYQYDTLGTLVREGLDVGANDALDLATADRITDHAYYYFLYSGGWYFEKYDATYATLGSTNSTVVAKQNTQLSNLPAGTLSSTRSFDVFGNMTVVTQTVDRTNKRVITTTNTPDSTTDTVAVTHNGLAVETRSQTNLITKFAYDPLGRSTSTVDPRIGANKTVYIAGTSMVDKFYDAYATARLTATPSVDAPTVTYHYDSAGRVDWTADAAGKKTYTAYTAERGEIYRQWGDATLPVEYSYDSYGRKQTMKSFRGGTGWTGSTWPSDPGTSDTTTWNYQTATGLLSSKLDADGKGVSFTYNAAGEIKTRVWARYLSGTSGDHVATTYYYFGENSGEPKTGELRKVDYNDSTPDVEYTYTRLGSAATVTDATGTRTFNYNLGTNGTLELQSEDLPSYFGSRRVTYPHATTAVVGRATGVQLGTSSNATSEQNVAWGFDTYGRFNSVAAEGVTLTYGYTTNSNLIAKIYDGTEGSGWGQTRTYLTSRDLLDIIEGKVGTVSHAKFDYEHDALGRRQSVRKTSDATDGLFARYGNTTEGLKTTFGYDDRSQVTSETTTVGTSTTALPGRNDAYAYDNFGNRSSTAGTTHNTKFSDYTTNSLNQYTARTVPAFADFGGKATPSATVTISSPGGDTREVSTDFRSGQYFFDGYPLDNSAGPIYRTLTANDGRTNQTTNAYLPKTAEVMTYDLDGNLLRDGRWVYVYDAENRLVAQYTRGAPEDPLRDDPTEGAANLAVWNALNANNQNGGRRLEFTHDYLGRRVSKMVKAWSGAAWTEATTRFVYDGWNLIAELNWNSSNSTTSLAKTFVWGLDWSGTLQGAGGVGGLLLIKDNGTLYQPHYDGNGNLMALTNRSTGALAAAYEYDAFGNTIRESGTYVANNSFRFSTKYTDLETGLVYYGLRYYSPSLGRFINRDPKGEYGGLNLYAFCRNNGVNSWDYLGMDDYDLSKANPEYRGLIYNIIQNSKLNIGYMMDNVGHYFVGTDRWNQYAGVWVANSPGGPASALPRDTLTYDRTVSGSPDLFQQPSGGPSSTSVGTGTNGQGSPLGDGQNGTALKLDPFVVTDTVVVTSTIDLPSNRPPTVLNGGGASPTEFAINRFATGVPETSPGYAASTNQLLRAITRNAEFAGARARTWNDAVKANAERGFFVYRNKSTGVLMTWQMPTEGATYNEMDPGNPPSFDDFTLLTFVHTHLDPSPRLGDRLDYPSDSDLDYSTTIHRPGIIINDKGAGGDVFFGNQPLPPPDQPAPPPHD